ncbi:hypothetical protein H310_05918 [Aphanomyces invadans]|uniref:Uncharacterized protein n=1 Tax=Aphanomyces invadans TaxID=157072 RepID=A0A024U975_9STRA|nr:hypothetical protein H310_05918 [Aphanomyces invadans]ETW02402.1 hypothetical protein H310_05918 [Aphanomyces invadans]|eukprot:XP_008869007.1 hypothetical protein H310_05918 [Aphanomyces invadans]
MEASFACSRENGGRSFFAAIGDRFLEAGDALDGPSFSDSGDTKSTRFAAALAELIDDSSLTILSPSSLSSTSLGSATSGGCRFTNFAIRLFRECFVSCWSSLDGLGVSLLGEVGCL